MAKRLVINPLYMNITDESNGDCGAGAGNDVNVHGG
jgi:hypothetical protein